MGNLSFLKSNLEHALPSVTILKIIRNTLITILIPKEGNMKVLKENILISFEVASSNIFYKSKLVEWMELSLLITIQKRFMDMNMSNLNKWL